MICLLVVLLLLVNADLVSGWRYQTRLMMGQTKVLPGGTIFVAGASRGTGMHVVKKLSAQGTRVNVLVRSPNAVLSGMPGVKVHIGDVRDSNSVQNAMKDCVAAITTVGGHFHDIGPPSERVDYVGNSNVVEQAGILGVERIVMITSVGCGDSKNALHPETYSSMEHILAAKSLAERDLKMYTNLDWTIIRPGALTDGKMSGKAMLSEDAMARGYIDREDLADIIVKVLHNPGGVCTRKTLAALDPSVPPYCNVPGSPYVKPFVLPNC